MTVDSLNLQWSIRFLIDNIILPYSNHWPMNVATFIFVLVIMSIYAYILISNSTYRMYLRSLYNIISTTSFEQSMSTVTAVTTGNRLNPQRTPADPEPDHQLGNTTSSISSHSFKKSTINDLEFIIVRTFCIRFCCMF